MLNELIRFFLIGLFLIAAVWWAWWIIRDSVRKLVREEIENGTREAIRLALYNGGFLRRVREVVAEEIRTGGHGENEDDSDLSEI